MGLLAIRSWLVQVPIYIHHERSGVCKKHSVGWVLTHHHVASGFNRGASPTLQIYIHHERSSVCKSPVCPLPRGGRWGNVGAVRRSRNRSPIAKRAVTHCVLTAPTTITPSRLPAAQPGDHPTAAPPTDIKCRGGMNVGHKCPTYESENNNRKPEIPPNCPLPLWGRAGVGFACIPRCSLTIDTD